MDLEEELKKKKMSKKKIFIIIGILVVAAIIVANLTLKSDKAVEVKTGIAKIRDLKEEVSASGRIQPRTKVDITSQINGEIIGLFVKEGDDVQKGQLLVVLDTVQLRSDVDQGRYAMNEVKARLSGARASLEKAEKEYDRTKELHRNKLSSATELDNAMYSYLNSKSSYEAYLAQTDQFRSRYEKNLDNLGKAKIVAPMNGIITFLEAELGEIAAAQTAFTQGKILMIISDLSIFEVEVEVDETEINKIQMNQTASIEVDAFPDTIFTGKVVEIGNTAIFSKTGSNDQTTNFEVRIEFEDPNVTIRPGMSATVEINTNQRDEVVSVPYSAIVIRNYNMDSLNNVRMGKTKEDQSAVSEVHAADSNMKDEISKDDDEETKILETKGIFIIKDGKAFFMEVDNGIADKRNVEILFGISAGDTVISGPYKALRSIKDGDPVKLEKPKKEKKK